jgi:hypothetical protein
MYRLGIPFLWQYYWILLREKHAVVLCCSDACGSLVGLVSGSLRAEEHMLALKKHRVRLALASIPAILKDPRVLKGLLSRHGSGAVDSPKGGYVVQSGPREEYWAWLPSERQSGGAVELHKSWLAVMRILGADKVRLELDRVNSKVEFMQRMLGAKVLRETQTPDGKERLILEYDLRAENNSESGKAPVRVPCEENGFGDK